MKVTFDISWVMLLQLTVAVLLPVIVGLVTKYSTSSSRKAVLLLALSVVTSLLTELLNAATSGMTYDLAMGLYTAITTFVVGVAVHYGLWKPTGTTSVIQDSLRRDPDEVAQVVHEIDQATIESQTAKNEQPEN